MFVSEFRALKAPYRVPQSENLIWLAEAHARAEGGPASESAPNGAPESAPGGRAFERAHKRLRRFGCGPAQIAVRGSFLEDFAHRDWARMKIYGHRADLAERQEQFRLALRDAVPALYDETAPPCGDAHDDYGGVPALSVKAPDFTDMIHVTCTGYLAPSITQEISVARGWPVRHLNAYHMGCYAALPALRMVTGETDLLHTELCTLHLDMSTAEPEQLVIQTLFADGVIRYHAGPKSRGPGYRIDEITERMAPATGNHMTWAPGPNGFAMTLAREVPLVLRESVAGVVGAWRTPAAVFAIHPGGPRVIDAVREALDLSEEQVFFSREILREYGNMSSATLPHVWARLLNEIKPGTPVISLAFGPGLTIAASRMTRV